MDNPENKQNAYADQVVSWAKLCAHITEDSSRAILGFIPNGLNITYDTLLKSIPVFGPIFSQRFVEQGLKLISGITIGQGLATDIAHYVFRPIGFALGALMGTGAMNQKGTPVYQGQLSKMLYRLSGQTVGGALFGVIGFSIANHFQLFQNIDLLKSYLCAAGIGSLFGLMAKGTLLIAINAVNKANAASARANVQRAKDLNAKLKVAARNKAKSFILSQAQDIIQQVNGKAAQVHFDHFLKDEYDAIAISTYKKIDRHFNYLTDRACHGDLQALKRLQDLHRPTTQPNGKNALEIMLERVFNARAIYKLKDDVDTAFDSWQYQYLKVKEA
jgi:hypothetical protein